jgi:long-subunit acyl-CoA synthetase (AMP-forming)
MSIIIDKIAKQNPDAIALESSEKKFSYRELNEKIEEISDFLLKNNCKSAAIMAQNCFDWIIIDLACLKAKTTLIPIAHFFSKEQISSLLEKTSPEMIFCQSFNYSIFSEICQEKSEILSLFCIKTGLKSKNIANCAKITFTSGSTGSPKGVCLSAKQIENVVFSLQKRVGIENIERNLSILPFSILLENIAGLYLTLISAKTCIILSPKETGLENSSKINIEIFAKTIEKFQPNSMILVPELAKILINLVQKKLISSKNFKFIAVGGAKIAKDMINQAFELKIPLFQGYGLSEFSSVVALNSVLQNRFGSVGKALDHVEIKIADDGEILLKNNAFIGYLDQENFCEEFYQTGDIGEIDEDGFLWIKGRKKNIFITSLGRNVNPEWIEGEFLQSDKIAQICVYGEAMPVNGAVIVPFSNNFDELNEEIARINEKLPDYAKVSKITIAKEPFSTQNKMLTGNGRMRRDAIFEFYGLL